MATSNYNKSVLSRFCIRIVNGFENQGEALSLPQRSIFWKEAQNRTTYLVNPGDIKHFCQGIALELRRINLDLTEFQEKVFLEEANKNVDGLRELFNVRSESATSDRYPARISRLGGYAASN